MLLKTIWKLWKLMNNKHFPNRPPVLVSYHSIFVIYRSFPNKRKRKTILLSTTTKKEKNALCLTLGHRWHIWANVAYPILVNMSSLKQILGILHWYWPIWVTSCQYWPVGDFGLRLAHMVDPRITLASMGDPSPTLDNVGDPWTI